MLCPFCGETVSLLLTDFEHKVIVEIKPVEEIHPKHKLTVLSYLRLTDKRLTLLINFNVQYIKDGITRLVNRLPETDLPENS